MSLAVRLASYFDLAVRSRGESYARARVEIRKGGADAVEAFVRGTLRYRVTLELSGSELRAACNCPYAEADFCKHIYALLLVASRAGHLAAATRLGAVLKLVLDDGELAEDEQDAADALDDASAMNAARSTTLQSRSSSRWTADPDEDRAPSHRDSRVSAPRPAEWEAILLEASAAGRNAALEKQRWVDREIAYVVEITHHGEPEGVTIQALEKGSGPAGKWKALSMTEKEIELLPREEDRLALHMFGTSSSMIWRTFAGSYDRMVAAKVDRAVRTAGHLLEAVFRTGRAYWNAQSIPATTLLGLGPSENAGLAAVTFDDGEPWQARIDVDPDLSGCIVLRGSLARGDEQVDLVTASLIAPGIAVHRGRAIRYLDDGVFPWLARLRVHGVVELPAAGLGIALRHLLSSPAPLRIEIAPELGLARETVTPVPYAFFRSPRQTGEAGGFQVDAGVAYDGVRVRFDEAGRWAIDAAGSRMLERDAPAETKAREFLISLGARPLSSIAAESPAYRMAAGRFSEAVRALATAGWRVEADGKPQRTASDFRIEVTSGIDWFDVTVDARFGEASARMAEILAALRNGSTTVILDDGSVGMLPEEWLRRWGLLAAAGEMGRGKLRFQRGHAVLLDALLSERPEVNCDATFAAMRQELASFESIAPLDAPAGLTGKLRDYQREGLGWMKFLDRLGLGGCLADDMGLGKTVQVLAMLLARKEERRTSDPPPAPRQPRYPPTPRKSHKPNLVVVPRSLLFNWLDEAKRFAPGLVVHQHHGLLRETPSQKAFADYDVVLTTYGTLRRDATELAEVEFDYVVLDEATAIKTESSAAAKAAKLLRCERRLALTGTPIENHLGELWSLFEFLNPGMLGSSAVFKRLTGAGPDLDDGARDTLRRVLRPFILRRTKGEVAKELPARIEQTLYADLEGAERSFYDELRNHVQSSLRTRVDRDGIARSTVHILEGLLRLRQAACHPGLVDKKRARDSSSKLDVLVEKLRELRDEGEKALVFSQFTSFLSFLQKRLDAEKITYEYLDGKTRNRKGAVERFESDPACPVFLISLKAGGVGLNLTSANYVFLLDPWWNPAVEAQAIDRAHRIGQTKTVFAYRILTKGTVEEKVAELQRRKRALADAILGEAKGGLRGLTRDDLELLLTS